MTPDARTSDPKEVVAAQQSGITAAALGLFVTSLVLLYLGGFIQFDDTSGFGSTEWVMSVGLVAGLAALCSVAVAISRGTARRALGAMMAVLTFLIIVQVTTNDGFRFIWAGDEGELVYLQVLLALASLILLTPRFFKPRETTGRAASSRALSPWARAVVYLCALVLVVFVAFLQGVAHFESTECSGPDFGGECDLAGIEGLLWAAVAFILVVAVVATTEVVLTRKRRATHANQPLDT